MKNVTSIFTHVTSPYLPKRGDCIQPPLTYYIPEQQGSKEGHKYFAASSLLCMIMAIYTGHKMISGKSRKKKEVSVESVED